MTIATIKKIEAMRKSENYRYCKGYEMVLVSLYDAIVNRYCDTMEYDAKHECFTDSSNQVYEISFPEYALLNGMAVNYDDCISYIGTADLHYAVIRNFDKLVKEISKQL
ncbi:MAG: hypothetical protein K0S41_2036 [Anaerocolumna sp.]|jgi:hypothetical protein|nr:hypothetical protein [Anaerocolumna sp.]